MRFPSAPPIMKPSIVWMNLLSLKNRGIVDSPIIIARVRYTTISFTPANSPNEIPLFVACVKKNIP